jgi:hypothetical protein
LDELVGENRYLELERNLPAVKLTKAERTYFEGILADRTHHAGDAIALLEKVLPELKAAMPTAPRLPCAPWPPIISRPAATAMQQMRMPQCSRVMATSFPPGDLHGFSDNLQTYELLRGAPAQLITGSTSFTVPTRRDLLGNTDLSVRHPPSHLLIQIRDSRQDRLPEPQMAALQEQHFP